jgi:hypothetical protein
MTMAVAHQRSSTNLARLNKDGLFFHDFRQTQVTFSATTCEPSNAIVSSSVYLVIAFV